MKTQSFFVIIIWGLISFSCCSSKQVTNTNTNTSTQTSNTQIVEVDSDQMGDWSSQPNSSSYKIKVLNAAVMFSSLPNGFSDMGYGIVENTGNSLTSTIRGDIRVRAWIDGADIILTSQVQQYTDNGFGQREPSELMSCVKGSSTSIPDCWRTILIMANGLGGNKQYQ